MTSLLGIFRKGRGPGRAGGSISETGAEKFRRAAADRRTTAYSANNDHNVFDTEALGAAQDARGAPVSVSNQWSTGVRQATALESRLKRYLIRATGTTETPPAPPTGGAGGGGSAPQARFVG